MHSARKRLERRQAELLVSPRRKGAAFSKVPDLTEWEEQQIRKKLRRASNNLEEYFSVFATERGGCLDFDGFGRAVRCVSSVNSRVTNREVKALWATIFDKRDRGYVRVSRIVKWINNESNNYVRRRIPEAQQPIQKHRYIVLHDFSSNSGKEEVSTSKGSGADASMQNKGTRSDAEGETKGAAQGGESTLDHLFERGRSNGESVLSTASSKAYTP